MINPTRIDPTRTTMIRRAFVLEMRRRFEKFKRALLALVEGEDAFGITTNARWKFLTTEEQLRAFQAWIEAQVLADILGKSLTDPVDVWLESYIAEGYRKGLGRAFLDTRTGWTGISLGSPQMEFFRGTQREFLQSAFFRPVSLERVKLLASRTFTDLKGVTEAMAQNLSRELVDGLIRGESPRVLARTLAKTVDGIGKTRASTIARTEIIRAHAEGQLAAFEQLGVTELRVMVEWRTAGDFKVCSQCRPLEGVVLRIKEARGMIPRHPNCRCSFIPANVGESKKDQNRGKARIDAAIRASIKAEIPKRSKRSIATQRRRSKWQGAGVTIAKKRPRSLT